MSQLPLTNVITISVSQANPGIGNYNTSNLALFTDDAPTGSVETLSLSGVAASGTFVLNFGSLATAAINYSDTAGAIQSKINALSGFGQVIVSGSIASQSLVLTQSGQFGSIPLVTVSSNSLQTSGAVAVTVTPVVSNSGWSGGALGYAAYLTPTQVGVDFGTGSKTSAMANAIFSQQPNILTGNGQLVIILLQVATQTLTLSGVAASGAFELSYGANTSASIAWNSTPAQIQAILQSMPGFSQVQVYGSIASELLTVVMNGVYGAATALSATANTLETSGTTAITITDAITVAGETVASAITRTAGLVQYFGVLVNENLATIGQVGLLAAAAVLLPLVKMGFFVSTLQADIAPGGMIDLLRSGGFTNTRGLYYGDTSSASVLNSLVFCASYAGRGLSTNFSGSNTTSTMHLKPLSGVQPDPTMTQTILNTAVAAGADTYVSLQGVSSIFCSGANSFFDQVYNLLWFTGALQVAGFNYLAQSNTKIPQTESGMDGLKGAYRAVCEQGITNQYGAAGVWNNPTVFGNPADLIANVAQRGYYIYSQPISQQSQANRVARQAPLVQIAFKQAGAIQSSTVIVNVNP
jgi:hypothetical protein